MSIEITVYGDPKPAGSKRAFGWKSKDGRSGYNVVDANPKAKGWKQEVARAAVVQMGRVGFGNELLTGALRVTFHFYRLRPKGHFKKDMTTLSRQGVESIAPTSKPDVLKLARGIEDSLTKVIWRDDAQIVDEHIKKDWGEPARVRIIIEPVERKL